MIASILQAVVSTDDDGLTLAEIVADIPHDAAAIFVYMLLGASLFAVIWFGARSSGSPGRREPS